MNERWRNDLNRLRGRRLVFWAVVLSLLVHVGVFSAVFFFPESPRTVARQDEPIWIDFDQLDLPSPKPEGTVLSMPSPSNLKTPEKAEFLAKADNAVEKETHRADIPINERMSPVGPRSRRPGPNAASRFRMPKVGEGMTKASVRRDKEKTAPGGRGIASPGGKSLKDLVDSVASLSPGGAPGGDGGGVGNASPWNPDVGEAGKAVRLNTRDFKYVGYFSGIKEKIEWAWVYPQEASARGQQGTLTLSFTILRSGKLKEVRGIRSSGFPLLDQAARRGIEDAADFSSFPEAWPDEEITIVANFSYRLIGVKSVF